MNFVLSVLLLPFTILGWFVRAIITAASFLFSLIFIFLVVGSVAYLLLVAKIWF